MRLTQIGQILFFLSFLPLRWRIGQELGWERAWTEGVAVGFYFDVVVSFLPWCLGRALGTLSMRAEVVFRILLALFFWAAALANSLYFLFFQSKLHWWIVTDHWSDVLDVKGSVGQLSDSWTTVLSVVLCVGALALWCIGAPAEISRGRSRRRHWRLAEGLGALLVVLQLQQLPLGSRAALRRMLGSAHDVNELRSVAYDHPIVSWITSVLPQREGPFATQGSVRLLALDEDGRRHPERWMAAFRDSFRQPPASYTGDEPLVRDFVPNPALSAEWRKILGFASDRRLNVVYLFVESFRSFEYRHPIIGPAVFPKLRERVARQAVDFTQAYSSVFAPGQTVRGLLTTNCSFLENLLGPATVIGNPLTEMSCVQEFLAKEGYLTFWLAAHRTTFHNKDRFEARHGTRNIVPREDYIAKGKLPTEPFDLKDADFFPAVLKRLREIYASGGGGVPFYLHTINLGTHTPWHPHPEGPIPENVRKLVSGAPNESYLGYLSAFRLLDESLSEFIDGFMASSLASSTLLVVMGDHSVPLEVPLPLGSVQREEVKFRVPVFFFSKGLKKGLTLRAPIHQMDVTPTVATILGTPGQVTWLGTPLSPRDEGGTPWVYDDAARNLSYRDGRQACYTLPGADALSCYALKDGEDPLFDVGLDRSTEDLAETFRFRSIAEASFLSLSFNRIQRRKAR
jgi:hypothetical protein